MSLGLIELASRHIRQIDPEIIVTGETFQVVQNDGLDTQLPAQVTQSLRNQGLLGMPDEAWNPQAILEAIAVQVPEGLCSMIEQELDSLPQPVQQRLEAASVVGAEFSIAAVAAAVDDDLGEVEAQFERFVRQRRFLRRIGLDTWPDGTLTTRYGFIHSLYQHVTYQRIGTGQRVQWHQRVASCLEAAYGSRVNEIAAEMALHFTQGHNTPRALHFLQQAANNAMHRYAYREADRHLTTGLDLLSTLADTPERAQQELGFLMVQRVVLGALKGFRAPAMAPLLARVQALYQHVEDIPPFAMAFWMGLWLSWQPFSAVRGNR